jgi:OOP family OmpA-OmpF porin
MKKNLLVLGILFISGCFFFMFFGCATQEEAVKDEEVEAPREDVVVKEEPVKEEVEEVEEVAEMVDSDDDGVSNDKDKCPDTPYGIEVDASGCPPDSDGDGVFDYLDKCPDTAYGAAVNSSGCPEGLPKLIDGVFKVVLEFNINSASIRSTFYNKYAIEVKKLMMENPEAELVRVEIKGHTDNTGTKKYNYQLSEKRANSVKRFIVDQFGVDSKIIKLQAFGATEPIASNSTRTGRQRNRRVEVSFTIKNLRE